MPKSEVALRPQDKYLAVVKSEGLAKQMAQSVMDNDPQFVKRVCAYMANAALKAPTLYNANKDSIIKVMLDCCAFGIEPNGRDAYVLPYKSRYGTQAQLIISYQGYITLAMKSERISSIRSELVCENDQFSWHNGHIEHTIDWLKPRGEMVAVYAVALWKDGHEDVAVLTKAECDATRARSRAKDSGPWVTDYGEMCRKTSVRRLAKYLPLSPAAVAAIAADDEQFEFNGQPHADVVPHAADKVDADTLAAALIADEPAAVEEAAAAEPVEEKAQQSSDYGDAADDLPY